MRSYRVALISVSIFVLVAMTLAACSPATQAPQATAQQLVATQPAAAAQPTQAAVATDWSTVKSVADGGGMDALVAALMTTEELLTLWITARMSQDSQFKI